MAKKHMKKCSPSLPIKEMQIKTTVRFYLTFVRTAIIKKHHQHVLARMWGEQNPGTSHSCQNSYHQEHKQQQKLARMREKGNLIHCCLEFKLVQPLWETVCRLLKKLKIDLPYDAAIPLLGT
jgi:hypothetical protein